MGVSVWHVGYIVGTEVSKNTRVCSDGGGVGLTNLVKTIFPTSLLTASASADDVESFGTAKSKTASNLRGRRCMSQTMVSGICWRFRSL